MTPLIGVAVTLHNQSESIGGEIVRVASTGSLFWFSDSDGSTLRATIVDGIWREDTEYWPMALGDAMATAPWTTANGALDDAICRLRKLEPWLLRRRWYPMSYMLIPGVLQQARVLLATLDAWPASSPEEKSMAAENSSALRRLISEFHRVG